MRHATGFWADRRSNILAKGILFWAAFAICGLFGIRLLDRVVGRSADRVAFSLPNDAQLAGSWSGDGVTLRNHLHGDWLQAELWTISPRPVLLRSFLLHQGQGQGLFHLHHVFISGDADGPMLSMNGSLLTLQLSPAGPGRATRLSFHRSL